MNIIRNVLKGSLVKTLVPLIRKGGITQSNLTRLSRFHSDSDTSHLHRLLAQLPSSDNYISSETMGEGEEEMVIRVRGLPWSATKDDVIKFFDGVDILSGRDGVHLTLSREGRPSGEAYIELENQSDLDAAEKKHNQHMGRRYIEVFKAKRSEMEWVIKRSGYGAVNNDDDGCVRLRGLPFGCSKEEIAQFFSGMEIVPNGIALPTDYQGRHTGEAYVQFVSKEVAEKALQKHKEKIAHRYIEIFRSNLGEIRNAMNPKMRGGPGGGIGGGGGPIVGYNSRPTPYDSRDRFGGMNRYGGSAGGGGRGGRSRPGGWGGNSGYNDGPSWSPRGGGRMSGGMGSGSMKGSMSGSSRGSFSSSTGHCVHMRGLPFRATEMDIADFFRPLNPVNITITHDNSGRPSGEADVEFATHDDAVKAMSKDKAHMQHRYIELFLNSTPVGNIGIGGGPIGGHGGPMGGGPGGNFGGPSGGGFGGSAGGMGGGVGVGGDGFGGGYGDSCRMGGFRLSGGRNYDDMGGPGYGSGGGMNIGGGGSAMGSFGGFNGSGGFGPGDQMSGNNYNSFC